jgi:short subunit fatty acids transporter
MATDDFEKKAKEFDVSGALVTSVITALSFTVGMFWKDVITKSINEVLPAEQTLFYEYLAAALVTVLAVFASYLLLKTNERTKQLEKKHGKIIRRKIMKMEKANKTNRKKLIKRLRQRV